MTVQSPAAAQPVRFPIVESFTQPAPANPYWHLLGSARLNGSLELTPDERAKAGTAFLDQPFSSSLGVTIDFDYACEGGIDPAFGMGDGFCVYLIDGEATTAPGAHGGGLGYSCIAEGASVPGVTAGYIGIGFDNYGNFASTSAGPGGQGPRPDTLGVRGSGNLMTGFSWLTGAAVPGGFKAAWEAGAHIQVSIIDGRLTVRSSSTSHPDGVLLINDFDLAGRPGQVVMPATFKLGFAAGTGGATAAHRIRNLAVALPVSMPLEMSGQQAAQSGDRISYTIGVQNLGPNSAPDAVVEGAIPEQLRDVELACRGENGAQHGAGSVTGGLRQPLDLPRGSKAVITLSGTVDPLYEGTITCTSLITSPTLANTASQQSGSVRTEIESPLISIGHTIAGQWEQSWPEDAKGWLVSYHLTLAANERRVAAWEISFDVPPRTRINPQQTQWYRVISDGSGGTVLLGSPDDGSHTIDPGTPLPVAVQLLYPTQDDAGDGDLRNLRATEVTHP